QGVVGNLRQVGHRSPGLLALHRLAARIDRTDPPVPAGAAQVGERPASGLGDVVRRSDDGQAPGSQQGAAQVAHALGARWSNFRSNTASAILVFRISVEPPAIIQPRVRRKQYSTSVSWL